MSTSPPESDSSRVPLKIVHEDEQYIRVKYNFYPKNLSTSTISRELIHKNEEPNVGYVDHVLDSGEILTFKGNWRPESDNLQECVLVFRDNEVLCVPVKHTLTHLKKTSD